MTTALKTRFTLPVDLPIFFIVQSLNSPAIMFRRFHHILFFILPAIRLWATEAPPPPAEEESWVPMIEIAWADSVIHYDPGAMGENTGNEPDIRYRNPNLALGPPDHSDSTFGTVALGNGGTLILQFRDNILYDGSGPDLCFWMPDSSAEEAVVFISRDGRSFSRAGTVSSDQPLLDIRSAAKAGQFYTFIKIRDNVFQGATDTPDQGADIDAACALHTGMIFQLASDKVFIGRGIDLQPEAGQVLADVIDVIQSRRQVQVLIEIFSNGGMSDFNTLLTQQQAGVLRNFLRDTLSLPAEYTAVGMGSSHADAVLSPDKALSGNRIQIFIQYD